MKGTEEFGPLVMKLNSHEIAMLRKSYFSIYLNQYHLLLVHGGISNSTQCNMPATYEYLNLSNNTKPIQSLQLLTKTRFINSQGQFVAMGQEGPSDTFWADSYKGEYGHIIFGHQPFIQASPKQFQHATGIDTGCVYGGWLTALIYEKIKPTPEFISIKSNVF